MKTKESEFHLGVAPTSRARCRRCKRQVLKGETRVVTTVFVKWGHTTRFTHCINCIDKTLASAIVSRYGDASRLRAAPDVEPSQAEIVRAAISRA